MTEIYKEIGSLLEKLTETLIAHQIAVTGSATLMAESDKYSDGLCFTLEPVDTYNVLAKTMILGIAKEYGKDDGLILLHDILLGCFTANGDISDIGLQIAKDCLLECFYEDSEVEHFGKVLH